MEECPLCQKIGTHTASCPRRVAQITGKYEPGLLGDRPSRTFKIFRTEFPAIFRFNGRLYQEHYDIDANENLWIEISEERAEPWLKARTDDRHG